MYIAIHFTLACQDISRVYMCVTYILMYQLQPVAAQHRSDAPESQCNPKIIRRTE